MLWLLLLVLQKRKAFLVAAVLSSEAEELARKCALCKVTELEQDMTWPSGQVLGLSSWAKRRTSKTRSEVQGMGQQDPELP